MYILSKYFDYYDHLKGIYGVDDKLILDRRKGISKPLIGFNDFGVLTLYICGKVIQGYIIGDKSYWGKEQLDKIATGKLTYFGEREGKTHSIISTKYSNTYQHELNCNFIVDPEGINKNKNCPILILDNNLSGINKSFLEFPNLKELGISIIIPAHDMWLMLSEWLATLITESEPSVPIGDDKVRILSHGFDLKQSFRHRKTK